MTGDGFVTLADGSRRWGRFGAAGLLVRHAGPSQPYYFLARRSLLCHEGGTWAIPGGAIDEGEHPADAARREFREEVGIDLAHLPVSELHEDRHLGWSYWTVVVDVADRFALPGRLNWETEATAWVARDEMGELPLHSGFEAMMRRLGVIE